MTYFVQNTSSKSKSNTKWVALLLYIPIIVFIMFNGCVIVSKLDGSRLTDTRVVKKVPEREPNAK